MKINGRLSIGELSKETGVKVVTIRYYEQIKLMPSPLRTEGNYRAYKREHLHRLQFIRRCRDLGFTLDQVRELLRLSLQGKRDCSGIGQITAKHLEDVQRKIADFKRPSGRVAPDQSPVSGKPNYCRLPHSRSPVSQCRRPMTLLNPKNTWS
jgi:DNA-binding transcriptional MerR regulator